MNKPRVVVCAAIQITMEDKPPVIFCGARHYDKGMNEFMKVLYRTGWMEEEEQGFIDQFGVFMTREEAYVVARDAGQIKYRCGGDEGVLFSENLY